MRSGFLISLLVHTVVFVIAIFGLPHFSNDNDPIRTAIPVSVISEADLARLDVLPSEPATLIEAPQIDVPDEPLPPETEVAAAPPEPVERPEPPPIAELPAFREPEPPPEVALAPEPELPEPMPALEPDSVALPEPEPEPEAEPEPEPEPEPEQPPDVVEEPEPVTELAQDVPPEPVAAEDPPETQVAALPPPPLPARRPERPPEESQPDGTFGSLLSSLAGGQVAARPRATELSGAQRSAVDQAVRECWNVDLSAPNAREILPRVTVVIGPDGAVEDASVDDVPEYRSDPIYRSAADRARRAVLNPRCARDVQRIGLDARTYVFRFIP